MRLQIFYYAGEFDFLGNEITEDRYIITDENGFDVYGDHFSLSEASNLLN